MLEWCIHHNSSICTCSWLVSLLLNHRSPRAHEVMFLGWLRMSPVLECFVGFGHIAYICSLFRHECGFPAQFQLRLDIGFMMVFDIWSIFNLLTYSNQILKYCINQIRTMCFVFQTLEVSPTTIQLYKALILLYVQTFKLIEKLLTIETAAAFCWTLTIHYYRYTWNMHRQLPDLLYFIMSLTMKWNRTPRLNQLWH